MDVIGWLIMAVTGVTILVLVLYMYILDRLGDLEVDEKYLRIDTNHSEERIRELSHRLYKFEKLMGYKYVERLDSFYEEVDDV